MNPKNPKWHHWIPIKGNRLTSLFAAILKAISKEKILYNCPNCKAEIDGGVSVCHNCKASLNWQTDKYNQSKE